ncbi:MAG: GntR family transcriptional regulator [Coriobacteriia bacterium]|nr:GntR family transcriptional regulator [Coriobacteriia bacterium]
MLKFSTEKPIYIQIVDLVQARIIMGHYPPESKLPSVRDFAVELGVNPNTVQRALVTLEQGGFVKCAGTAGRFVTGDRELIEKAREKMVCEKALDFATCMKQCGCGTEEAIKAVRRYMEGTGEPQCQ